MPARRRASVSVREESGALYSLQEVLDETKADAKLVRELEEYGVVKGEQRGGQRYYDETEREIIGAVSELARYGVGGRNLRVFRTSADREAGLLQQILAPALRSRNPQRRKEALEALENLAAVASHLQVICCWCATCARSPNSGGPPPHAPARWTPGPPVGEECGSWSPTPTTCRGGGHA